MKREADRSTELPNEASIYWRKLDLSSKTLPFSGWAVSKRNLLRITSDGIYCGETTIQIKDIEKAVIFSPTDSPLGKGSQRILRITTDHALYDINISPFKLEKMDLPFETENSATELVPKKYSRLIFPTLFIILILMILINRSC